MFGPDRQRAILHLYRVPELTIVVLRNSPCVDASMQDELSLATSFKEYVILPLDFEGLTEHNCINPSISPGWWLKLCPETGIPKVDFTPILSVNL